MIFTKASFILLGQLSLGVKSLRRVDVSISHGVLVCLSVWLIGPLPLVDESLNNWGEIYVIELTMLALAFHIGRSKKRVLIVTKYLREIQTAIHLLKDPLFPLLWGISSGTILLDVY